MKLLFDENLSPLLSTKLADLYPDSAHVHHVDLGHNDDQQIWAYARANSFLIVAKDSDFAERSSVAQLAPKIVWIRLGNCTTNAVEMLLRARHEEVLRFWEDTRSHTLRWAVPSRVKVRGWVDSITQRKVMAALPAAPLPSPHHYTRHLRSFTSSPLHP